MINRDRIAAWFKAHWGLLFLVAVIGLISLQNYTSQFTIAGWDNFSANFDLSLNLPRTFFATWREYRGLGVPSDSEVVDIFRQIPLWFIGLVTTASAALTAYYLILYAVGIVSTYFLVRFFLRRLYLKASLLAIEAGSLVAALFYGFNLNTFETFFLPITIYVARFAFLPLFTLVFLKMLTATKRTIWSWFAFVVVTLLLSTAYLTATVFFTVLLVLLLIGISYYQKARVFVTLLVVFLALNAFWLLPFGNYYQQKAALIPVASSFISVNESLLNKPPAVFSWSKISSFYPEILSTHSLPFRDAVTQASVPVHQLVGLGETNDQRLSLLVLLPVLLAFIGIVWLAWYGWRRKDAQVIWVVLLALGMLFLLRREYLPLGWLYDWLGTTIPLFKIVFRFGGAKFSPLLVLSLVLALGFMIASLLQLMVKVLDRKLARVLILVLIAVTSLVIINPFVSFFSGSLFSPLILVKLPKSYQRITDKLNQDMAHGRVIHLPMDQFSYWKSYDWGYIGSNFLSFMTSAPIIDRTFEPASLENDFFNLTLQRLINNRQIDEIYALLQKTGVKYILYDESVGSLISSRGLIAWGVFAEAPTSEVIESMVEAGYLVEVEAGEINTNEIGEAYNTDERYSEQMLRSRLILYQVQETEPTATFISEATNVDPLLLNAFIDPLLVSGSHFIQSAQPPSTLFPFWQTSSVLELDEYGMHLTQPVGENQSDFSIKESTGQTHIPVIIEIMGTDDGAAQLRFSQFVLGISEQSSMTEVTIPATVLQRAQVASSSSSPTLSNWQVVPYDINESLRLKVADNILPLPNTLSDHYQFVAATLVASSAADIQLLGIETNHQSLLPSDVQLTDNPNCFGDQTAGYDFNFDNSRDINVTTQNGMTCLSTPLVVEDAEEAERLYELTFSYQASSEYLPTGDRKLADLSRLQNQVRTVVDSLPTFQTFSVCLLGSDNVCLNAKQWARGMPSGSLIIPAAELTKDTSVQALITVPANKDERNTLLLQQPTFNTYVPIWEEQVMIPEASGSSEIIVENGGLELTFPYFLTANSYIFNETTDGLNSYSGACAIPTGYRRLASANSWPILSYLENCFQGLSVTLPYEAEATYLWQAEYMVFMGKQPQFIARQETEVLNEYLSRFSGYPSLPGIKSLQVADVPWRMTNEEFIVKSVNDALPISAFTALGPQSGDSNQKMIWEISQQGEGQSLIGLKNMNIAELPASWKNIELIAEGSQMQFGQAEVVSVQQIWPSLWKMEVKGDTPDRPVLLKFGQAYDQQWQLYQTNSILDVLLNRGKVSAELVRVDGWSNGWIIPAEAAHGQRVFYAFYAPERLALIGWGITLATGVGILVWSGLKRARFKR